jgi:hypothetical protein
MASFLYNSLASDIFAGNVDFANDTFKAMLVTSSYSPSQSHSKRSDITNEVTGTGYTAGGLACVVGSVSRVGGLLSVTFNNVVWPAPVNGFTARRCVVYKSRGGASSADELAFCVDFGTGVAANNTTFTVTFTSALTCTTPQV